MALYSPLDRDDAAEHAPLEHRTRKSHRPHDTAQQEREHLARLRACADLGQVVRIDKEHVLRRLTEFNEQLCAERGQ